MNTVKHTLNVKRTSLLQTITVYNRHLTQMFDHLDREAPPLLLLPTGETVDLGEKPECN